MCLPTDIQSVTYVFQLARDLLVSKVKYASYIDMMLESKSELKYVLCCFQQILMSVVRTLTTVLRSVPILLVATSASVMMATLGTLTVTLAMVSTLFVLISGFEQVQV